MTPTSAPNANMGGDPHYSILLATGQLLCYSVHGEHDFAFNLLSNKLLTMNALFIADSIREEITWIGELGIVVKQAPKKKANATQLRFCAKEKTVCVGDKMMLNAASVERLSFGNGRLAISERKEVGDLEKPEVLVEFPDIGMSLTVVFVRGKHLDMIWNKVEPNMGKPHGMIGMIILYNYLRYSNVIFKLLQNCHLITDIHVSIFSFTNFKFFSQVNFSDEE